MMEGIVALKLMPISATAQLASVYNDNVGGRWIMVVRYFKQTNIRVLIRSSSESKKLTSRSSKYSCTLFATYSYMYMHKKSKLNF